MRALTRRASVLAVVACGLLLACGDAKDPDGTECASEYPPPSPLDAEFTGCEVDEDCVVVELGMCDACNGGTAVAVGTASELAVADQYAECVPDTGEWGCTAMACPPLYATCDAGACTLQQETTW